MAGQRPTESQADWIRRFVIENLDSLAKCRAGRLVIRAGDVAKAMGLSDRLPNICSVLASPLFLEQARLTLECRTDPKAGWTPRFFYKHSGPTKDVPSGTDSSEDLTLEGQRDNESQADWIRRSVIGNLDSFAKCRAGRLVIRAGDVAQAMGLSSRLPNICSVLRGRKFQEETGLTLLKISDPPQSTTTEFEYECSGSMRATPSGADSSTDGTGEQFEAELETEIRRQVIENLDELAPLRRIIRAGEVADSMGLKGRMAEVCSALSSRRFQEEARLAMEDAIFQYVSAPERAAPGLSSKSEIVDERAGNAVPREAAHGSGDRQPESRGGAAETSASLSSDRDSTGFLHRLWRVVRAWFGRFGRGADS